MARREETCTQSSNDRRKAFLLLVTTWSIMMPLRTLNSILFKTPGPKSFTVSVMCAQIAVCSLHLTMMLSNMLQIQTTVIPTV